MGRQGSDKVNGERAIWSRQPLSKSGNEGGGEGFVKDWMWVGEVTEV